MMRNFQWNKSKDGVWRGHLVRYPLVAEARIKPHREGFWFEVSARRGTNPVKAMCGFRDNVYQARAAVRSFLHWGCP